MELQVKAHKKQRELIFDEETKRILAVAGIRGGKTYAGAIKSLVQCSKYPGIRICVTAPTYKMLNDATLPVYREVFGMLSDFATFTGGDNPIGRTANECELIFRSTDNPQFLRGLTLGGAHMDEVGGSPHIAYQILEGRLSQIDKRTGELYPCQMWLTTTPRGLNWLYSIFVLNPVLNSKVIAWETKDNIFLADEYVKNIYATYDGKYKSQELEGQFWNLEGECVFSRDNLILKLADECLEPKYVEDGYVNIWKEPFIGKYYVAGVDCADEGGGGANCCIIIDAVTGEEVCEIWGDIAEDVFAKLINDWGRKYNNALLGIERNGVGNYIVAKMEDLNYPSLYRDERGKTGWYTNVSNRTSLLAEYHVAVDRNQAVIRNAKAIEEMLTFVRKANDKWEHIEGNKDDRVMARAIAWQMLKSPQIRPQRAFTVKRKHITYA